MPDEAVLVGYADDKQLSESHQHIAEDRKAIYQGKGEIGKERATLEERTRTYRQWQELWDQETRGRWTARLIPMVQLWTGSPDCTYCPAVPDDAEYTFFRCPHWERPRLEATRTLGVFSVDSVCQVMLEGEDNWNCVSHFVQGILRAKKIDLDLNVV
ncbi:uncharacterized protein LOC124368247 [Homalodisca vitripennis]|uniref:uncharacterized protein LOC124368247 n=1 Tax=Homalodisca vitripennis TaxID=197043 RepID=UPI001EEC7910|nr:uncharacterized protein LOC124368247 [Homalodisca vitripennis]